MNPYHKITKITKKTFTEAQISMQNGIVELNREKEVNSITVKNLCAYSHVARSTFYAYYNNIDELMEDVENNLISKLLSLNNEFMKIGNFREEDLDFFKETLDYVMEQKIFYIFLIARPNIRFISKWKEAIKYHFWERLFIDKVAKNSELILEMIASQAIAAFTFWLKNPYDVDISGVNKIIAQTLNSLDYSK